MLEYERIYISDGIDVNKQIYQKHVTFVTISL